MGSWLLPGFGGELHGLHHAGAKQESSEQLANTLGFGTSAVWCGARSFVA
ncbi:MAG TPA: hypothetical protein VFS57_04575 [Gemmatimonadaceae bacterium]|nr:hypothetical protein [Gemmatimonadaceae bacterium]